MSHLLRHQKISRRQFFGFGCALLPGAMTALPAIAWTPTAPTLIIVLDDIAADIDLGLANSIFDEFVDSGIPFSCILDAKQLEFSGTGSYSQLAGAVGAISARQTGLIEIMLSSDEDTDERRYFQLRLVESLRSTTAAFLNDVTAARSRALIPVISILERRAGQLADISAQRSAGFRVLVRPGLAGPMAIDFVGRGQMQLSGGDTLRLVAPIEEIRTQLDAAFKSERDIMLVLSLSDVVAADARQLRDKVALIAERVKGAIASQIVIAMRPMDLLFAAAPYLAADRALVLPIGETDIERADIRSFATELHSAEMPFGLTGMVAPDWLRSSDDFGEVWRRGAVADPARMARSAGAWLFLSNEAPAAAPDWAPGFLVAPGGRYARNGLRADGRMYLTQRDYAQVGLADHIPFDDLVVRINPRDIASEHKRRAILSQLQNAVWGGRIRLHTVTDLADLVLAPEPVIARLWSTQRRILSDPPMLHQPSSEGSAMLLEDARLAWSFIHRFTDSATGLCAGTVSGAQGGRVNLEASLWDIASQLQGIIAANSMGMISTDEAKDRVGMMLRNLPSINLAGLILPPAMFKTDRSADVAVRGFDFCDTGRFLIALRSAVASGLLTDEDATAVRDKWDLAAMVEDGHSFNISGDRRVDVTYSHCTPYIARAFHEIGLPLRSPYSALTGARDSDALIRLLYSGAYIGAMGTEPLLLQAIEQGASPEVQFLSAVLFDAQLSWYETTGQMKCVSEAPLNIEPWFIYQGLRVDRLGQEAWTIETLSNASRFQTAEFRQRVEVISAKSAYLWAAVHPHPYCDMLVQLMRDKGRIDNLGFSVGVFASTLEPMENYSDLNTNGIILSALAFMQKKSRLHP